MSAPSEEEIRAHLEKGGFVRVNSTWTISAGWLNCDSEDNCCQDSINSIDEAIDIIRYYNNSYTSRTDFTGVELDSWDN
jgi:hypothetical protein